MRYVKCLFCDERRQSQDFLCRVCRILYNPYKNEVWFKEFVDLEKYQRRITKIESANYDVSQVSKHSSTFWGSSRPRGRPRKIDLIEAYVRSIYSSNLSIRQLTKLCNAAGLDVSRESVRSIINKIKLTKNNSEV